jgi:gamma-glutamyltranspeptidase
MKNTLTPERGCKAASSNVQTLDLPAKSKKGMVTSPHELATRAGLQVLQTGGNAIEAAITMGACLNVTYPHFTGFGGDAFLIISQRNGKAQTISGIGQAAGILPSYNGSIPLRGPASMLTSAASVDALGRAFEISRDQAGGKMSWSDLLAPAINLAREGFPTTPSERFWTDFRSDEMQDLPGVVAGYMLAGKAREIGEIFRQPALAATLETLAERGYRDFYEGKLAAKIARGLAEAGSPLTALDLAKTAARIEPPLRVPYRGGELLAHQPPTQGVTTLQIMGILERFNLKSIPEGSADFYHLVVEAVKCAFLDRNRYVSDPDFSDVPCESMLSPQMLDRHAAEIDANRAREWQDTFKTGDTVFLAAADAAGNSVSMLQTIYFDWGSGVTVGDTGMLWHNRGASFNLQKGHPNVLAPGKRPFHTLNPGMYLRDGVPSLLYGTQGADGQPQTLSILLARLIDYGLDPLTALAKPRFLLGKTFSDSRDSLKLEADAGREVFDTLSVRGHTLSELPAQSPLAGHAGAIFINPETGEFSGAHDPRSDGLALGV